MTKASILALLSSVDSFQAGQAIAVVEGLDENDARFRQEFANRPNAAVGYWIEQKVAGNKSQRCGIFPRNLPVTAFCSIGCAGRLLPKP